MIKILYGADGNLIVPLEKTANKIVVDSTLLALLIDSIGSGDWAYLAIDDGYYVEIVKVYRVSSAGVYVRRGIDSTEVRNFGFGSKVIYTKTVAESVDLLYIPRLILLGLGAIQTSGSKISYILPNIQTLGGAVALVSESVLLDTDRNIHGCCDALGQSAPALPLEPIYYTSQIYPIEVLEEATGSMGVTSMRMLGLPIDDVTSSATLVSGELRTIVILYSEPPEDIKTSIELISGDLVEIPFEYHMRPENIGTTIELISGILENIVVHNAMAPENIDTTIELISGTLV